MAETRLNGGGDRIRTCEALARLADFKSAAFDHSATPPCAASYGSAGGASKWKDGQGTQTQGLPRHACDVSRNDGATDGAE